MTAAAERNRAAGKMRRSDVNTGMAKVLAGQAQLLHCHLTYCSAYLIYGTLPAYS
jgi:hypothetical protein